MARIELRYCTIRIKDGLSGTAVNNQPLVPPQVGDATLTITSVALNTDVTNKVPVGARFTIAGESDSDTVHTVTARTPSSSAPTTAITFSPILGAGTYTTSATAGLGAATTTVPGVAATTDEVQQIARFTNKVTGGNYTLTISLDGDSPVTTGSILYSANAAAIQAAIDAAVSAHAAWSNGDIVVTGGPLTAAAVVLTFSGGSVDETDHGQTTIASVDLTAVTGNKLLTFLPQAITIKVGEGDLKYTETRNFKYDLDRGLLDTVRFGDDVALDVNSSFTYEHITSGTDETISPVDAIKRKGAAAEWVSSDSDPCQPYAVDLEITFTPPCANTADPEVTTFPDFRYEKIEPDFKNSLITLSGKCHATEPIVSRVAVL